MELNLSGQDAKRAWGKGHVKDPPAPLRCGRMEAIDKGLEASGASMVRPRQVRDKPEHRGFAVKRALGDTP